MSREPRVYYPGAIYHVMTRGNNREIIYHKNEEREKLLTLIKEARETYGFLIHGYCLMSNHNHFIMQVGYVPLYKIMHSINHRYAMMKNIKASRVGHLFQGRYKAKLVSNNDYLTQLLKYIHQNPLAAGIVNELSNYPWSSHHAYKDDSLRPAWLTTKKLLSLFDTDVCRARISYLDFMESERIADEWFEQHGGKTPFIGSESEIKIAREKITLYEKVQPTHYDVINLVSNYLGVTFSDLSSNTKRESVSLARGVIAYFSLRLPNLSLQKVGLILCKSSSGLSQAALHFQKKTSQDESLAMLLEHLTMMLLPELS